MSTLVTSNISDGTTTVGTGYVVNGSAKAWYNFDQYFTNTVRDSFNVSSVVDNSTGNNTANFSSAMANANYSPSGITQGSGTASSFVNVQGSGSAGNALTASAAPMRVTSPGAGQVDVSVCCYEFQGDLA